MVGSKSSAQSSCDLSLPGGLHVWTASPLVSPSPPHFSHSDVLRPLLSVGDSQDDPNTLVMDGAHTRTQEQD